LNKTQAHCEKRSQTTRGIKFVRHINFPRKGAKAALFIGGFSFLFRNPREFGETFHIHRFDLTLRIEPEIDKAFALLPVAPSNAESVVVPVFEIARKIRAAL
jgi:hypothetical protein